MAKYLHYYETFEGFQRGYNDEEGGPDSFVCSAGTFTYNGAKIILNDVMAYVWINGSKELLTQERIPAVGDMAHDMDDPNNPIEVEITSVSSVIIPETYIEPWVSYTHDLATSKFEARMRGQDEPETYMYVGECKWIFYQSETLHPKTYDGFLWKRTNYDPGAGGYLYYITKDESVNQLSIFYGVQVVPETPSSPYEAYNNPLELYGFSEIERNVQIDRVDYNKYPSKYAKVKKSASVFVERPYTLMETNLICDDLYKTGNTYTLIYYNETKDETKKGLLEFYGMIEPEPGIGPLPHWGNHDIDICCFVFCNENGQIDVTYLG
jgi:hypothetical protein